MANESVYLGWLGPLAFQSSAAGTVFPVPMMIGPLSITSTAVTSTVPIQISNAAGFVSMYAADGTSAPSNVSGLRVGAGSTGFFFETAANNNTPFMSGFTNAQIRTWNGSTYTDVLTVKGGSAATQSVNLGPSAGTPMLFVAAPTVTSAGTSPSITTNGTVTGRVNVGTGGTATTIVLAMPAATTGWNCSAENISQPNAANLRLRQTASTTTSVTLQWQTVSTGAATAFTASDIVSFIAFAY